MLFLIGQLLQQNLKKWGDKGAQSDITATVTVNAEGGTSVAYTPSALSDYMINGGK